MDCDPDEVFEGGGDLVCVGEVVLVFDEEMDPVFVGDSDEVFERCDERVGVFVTSGLRVSGADWVLVLLDVVD